MQLHPTQTPEYWERLARDERAFAKSSQQSAESTLLHRANAEQYERKASELREAETRSR